MTETSAPWDGTSTGDASMAPYDAPTEWAKLWRSLSGAQAITTNLSGVFTDDLNELEVSGTSSPVSVASGRALTYGTWYENTAAVSVVIPTPAGATRIDRIVLRKDWAAQTVRVTRIAGVEGGAAPALVQVAGTTWDQPLAQASITTGGVITVTDQRALVGPALAAIAETILSGAAASISFTSIPPVYRHLVMITRLRVTSAGVARKLSIRFNGDATATAYMWQMLRAEVATVAGSQDTSDAQFDLLEVPNDDSPTDWASFLIIIPHYANTTDEKTIIVVGGDSGEAADSGGIRLFTGRWNNVAAVNRVDLIMPAAELDVNSMATLYGIKG